MHSRIEINHILRFTCSTGLALFAAASMQAQGPGPGQPSLPSVAIDRRDYQDNISTTDRTIAPEPHPELEWSQNYGGTWEPGAENNNVSHVAYVKGTTPTINIRINNSNIKPVGGSLNFTDARLKIPGPNYTDPGPYYLPLSVSVSPASFTIPANSTVVLTASVNGLPDSIAVGALEVKYSMPLVYDPGGANISGTDNGTHGNWQTWERICVLDSTPIGLQQLPWTDFLEYTCRWAFGASGTNQVLKEMTRGIHYSNRSPWNRLAYDPTISAAYWPVFNNGSLVSKFNLTTLLTYLRNPIDKAAPAVWAKGDCRDFAAILHIALASQGASSSCILVEAQSYPAFAYWPLCPAGTDSTITSPINSSNSSKSGSYESNMFTFHVLVDSSNGLRYDSSSSYLWSTTGSIWVNPAFEWSGSTYWQRSSSPYFGLVYHSTNLYDFTVSPAHSGSEQVALSSIPNLIPSGVS